MLQPIVVFTHIVEDLLDQIRNQQLVVTSPLIKDLLESCDHIQLLISVVAEQGSALSDSDEMQDQRLRLALTRYQCV
ncbi:chemotaxis protein CheA, partial [Aeromonas hydrophila]